MKKIIITLVLLVMFSIPTVSVQAETLQDMNNKLTSLQNKLNTANSNKKLTEDEITNLKNEIATITANISQTRADIVAAENKITESEQEIENKKDECDEMLRVLQLSSDENAYLEYIIEADNYTDMIYRYAIVSQITNYNNEIMDELNTLISNLETEKASLSEKQKSLESEQSTLSSKVATLNANLAELTEEGTTIQDDITYLNKQIKYYKDTLKCSNTEEISACVTRYNEAKARTSKSNITTINATGWSYPLKGGCVSSEYVGYAQRTDWSGPASGHHGIDLACNSEGTSVYAAAPGYVARIAYSTCGGNQVYIYHTVNGKEYTTVYMHLLSVNVSVNQTVDENTVIGKVGGGSTATKNGGYDYCTTGAHLHFGLANGWHSVGFNSYSFNPRNIFNFPTGNGRFSR